MQIWDLKPGVRVQIRRPFIDLDGRYVWSGSLAAGKVVPARIDLFAAHGIAEHDPLRGEIGSARVVTGLVTTSAGPMLLALAPVLNGTGTGHPAGALLLGRLLSAAELARAAKVPEANVALVAVGPAGAMPAPARGTSDPMTVLRRRISDLTGAPSLELVSSTPRTISSHCAPRSPAACW